MSEDDKIVTPSEEEVAQYGGQAGSEPAEAEGSAAAETPGEPASETRSEADEWRERFLRAKADLANYQKRSEKERLESIRYAAAELAKALLPVLDDIDRVIAAGADEKNTRDALLEGVRLTRENFLKVFKQFHVTPIEAEGQPFDPSVHEAMMQQPVDDFTEPKVLQEVARGYRMHERVLRPSKVIVSKAK
jgi:molecular chaperone GrpE